MAKKGMLWKAASGIGRKVWPMVEKRLSGKSRDFFDRAAQRSAPLSEPRRSEARSERPRSEGPRTEEVERTEHHPPKPTTEAEKEFHPGRPQDPGMGPEDRPFH